MLVGDIYGGDYYAYNLPADLVASYFGRIAVRDSESKMDYTPSDVATSLIKMISHNIAQLAYLCATKINSGSSGRKIQRIVFSGNFLRNNLISQLGLTFSIQYWSGGKVNALFLRHEGSFQYL